MIPVLLGLPLVSFLGVLLAGRRPNVREAISVVVGVVTFGVCASLAPAVADGARPEWRLGQWLPGLEFAFRAEPLGVLFAIVASGLWIPTTLYAAGYMRGHHEGHQTRFFACFSMAIFAALAAAMSANLITLFTAYELMTVSTYPLVAHHGDAAARRGSRTYLGILLSTSIAFFLVAVAWTSTLAPGADFAPGGILDDAYRSGAIGRAGLLTLLCLFAFGIGKAALMPFHRWLPAAMVAPTPVSALLHAVAVVKVGVFSVLKVVVYVFGIDLLAETGVAVPLAYLAGFSILAASIVAMYQDNLKRRLAYSTVSQLGYITLGAFLANASGAVGGGMHIATHAVGKITLFFCAGAVFVAAHEKNISGMRGLGRRMPWTFGAFAVAAVSIIGLPPGGGAWSKWFLAVGTVEGGAYVLTAVLMISSLLNIAYLMPIPVLAFAPPVRTGGEDHSFDDQHPATADHHSAKGDDHSATGEAPLLCVGPLVLTAALSVILFFTPDPMRRLLRGMVGDEPTAAVAAEAGGTEPAPVRLSPVSLVSTDRR